MPWAVLLQLVLLIARYFLGKAESSGQVDAATAKTQRDNLNASLDVLTKAKNAGRRAGEQFDANGGRMPDDPNQRD